MKLVRLGMVSILCLVPLQPTGTAKEVSSEKTTFEESVQALTTPKELSKFMRKHFKFKEDLDLFGSVDYWQAPIEFFRQGSGDCEDYALFAREVLAAQGFDAHVVSFYGPSGYAHTVALYKDGERFNIMNDGKLYRFKSKTVEEALTRVHPNWSWGAFAERSGVRGRTLKRFLNPALF